MSTAARTQSQSAVRFRQDVTRTLARTGRVLKRRLFTVGLVRCAVVLTMLAIAQFGLDWLLVLGAGPRAALLVILLAVTILQIWRYVVAPARIAVTPLDIAGLMERNSPGLRDLLISAVYYCEPHASSTDSPALIEDVVKRARERFADLKRIETLNDRPHRIALVMLAGVMVVVGAFTLRLPDLSATYLARNWLLRDTSWPSNTRILLEGMTGNRLLWPQGDDLNIVATAQGEVPAALRAEIRRPAGGIVRREMARRGENQFVLDFGPLADSIKVRFLVARFGVDENTPWYDIEAVERPRILNARLTIVPPDYAQQSPQTVAASTVPLDILRGSKVTIDADVNKAVRAASLRAGNSDAAPTQVRDGKFVHAEFTPAASATYTFDLTDEGGLSDLHPLPFVLKVVADAAPKVRLALPGVGELIVPSAILDMDIECEDNLGLRRVALIHEIGSDSSSPTTAPAQSQHAETDALPGFEPRSMKYAMRHTVPVAGWGVKPGQILTLAIRAEDFQPAQSNDTPAGRTESIRTTLKVVTAEDLLAELGRRESEWRREFEQIVKAQEQIKKRILDLHDQAGGTNAFSPDASSAYGREETTQRGQIGRLRTIRRQFEQILAEMKVNQLDSASIHKRLESGVVQPLGRLANTQCGAVADKMGRLREGFDQPLADEIEADQSRLLEDMNAILAAMLKWEGYNEAVSLLRDVIRLQSDVNRGTQGRIEDQVEKLFPGRPASRPESP